MSPLTQVAKAIKLKEENKNDLSENKLQVVVAEDEKSSPYPTMKTRFGSEKRDRLMKLAEIL